MSFLRVALPILILGILVLTPSYAEAANAHFFGPIIDVKCRCDAENNNGVASAPDWGCVLDTAHNVFNLLFSLSILVFVLTAAWAGLLFMSTSVNPEGKSKAKSMLLNTVVGLLISLSAWLIVDFVMRLLYDDSAGFGPWNSILKDGDMRRCILPAPDAPSLGISFTPSSEQTTGDPTASEPVECPDLVPTVNLGSNAVVSDRAKNVLKDILKTACISSATITSGRRTATDQARVMFNNLNSGIRLNYASAGDAVTAVFDAQKAAGKTNAQIQAAMQAKIEEVGCINVSKHCSDKDVIDVSPFQQGSGEDTRIRRAIESSNQVSGRIFPPADPAYHIEFR